LTPTNFFPRFMESPLILSAHVRDPVAPAITSRTAEMEPCADHSRCVPIRLPAVGAAMAFADTAVASIDHIRPRATGMVSTRARLEDPLHTLGHSPHRSFIRYFRKTERIFSASSTVG
jgi:hypothetical protein